MITFSSQCSLNNEKSFDEVFQGSMAIYHLLKLSIYTLQPSIGKVEEVTTVGFHSKH